MPKICSKCRRPLSRGPRVRDSRGRVLCTSCHTVAPATGTGPGSCPDCGRPIGRRDAICTGCGLNLMTGQRANQVTSTEEAHGRRSKAVDLVLHPLSVALWGTGLLVGAFSLARADGELASAFLLGTVLAWLGCGLYILYRGWQEDGIIGVLYSYRYPLGGILEEASGRRLTAIWLLVFAAACSLLLAFKYPEVGNELIPKRPSRTAHDILLPGN
jgi:hypothetical protein